MKKRKIYKVIGIMTGTSMDGIDLSFINTEGKEYIKINNEKNYQFSQKKQIELKHNV